MFHGRKRLSDFVGLNLNIQFDSEIVDRVESYQCLGLLIDEQLSFNDHVEMVYKKCVSMTYALKRSRSVLTEKLAYRLYYAHIFSHLIYLNPLWNITTEYNLNRLFVLQKKCLRIIQRKDLFAPSSSLFSYKVLPLPVINNYHLLILAFKIKKGLIKNNIVLRYINEIHTRNTRLSLTNNFYVLSYETKYGFADFYRRGLIKFNEMPDYLKLIGTLSRFKDEVRRYLFEEFVSNI